MAACVKELTRLRQFRHDKGLTTTMAACVKELTPTNGSIVTVVGVKRTVEVGITSLDELMRGVTRRRAWRRHKVRERLLPRKRSPH